jgi:hypothetical protein
MPTKIRIKGQAELERAFLQLRKEVLAELKPMLKEIGEEVRSDAQARAGADISHIGTRWDRMRTGVTLKGVYVAPTSRRRGGSPRPNLAGLLWDKAMEPARDEHEESVLRRAELLVDASAAFAGF